MPLDFYSQSNHDHQVAQKRAPQILVEKKAPPRKKEWDVDYGRLSFIFIIYICSVLVWWLFYSDMFRVTTITYTTEPSTSVKSKIEMLKGKNIFIVRTGKLISNIQKEQPSVKNMKIYRGLPDALRVNTEERSKALVWLSNKRYYLMDADGVAYRDLGVSPSETVLPIVDKNNLKVKLGQQIVSRSFVEAAQKLLDDMPSKIGSEKITELDVGESSFTLEVVTDKKIRLIFDITQPLDLQLDAVEYLYKEKRGDIKTYADLRVLGKAYVK